uniref:Signal peptide protein n=1 Tax=Heterorhabditis bacteriophora TaxID=37862 RepID=A0A1I7WLU5_HETBA
MCTRCNLLPVIMSATVVGDTSYFQTLYPTIAITVSVITFLISMIFEIKYIVIFKLIKHFAAVTLILYPFMSCTFSFVFVRPYRKFIFHLLSYIPCIKSIDNLINGFLLTLSTATIHFRLTILLIEILWLLFGILKPRFREKWNFKKLCGCRTIFGLFSFYFPVKRLCGNFNNIQNTHIFEVTIIHFPLLLYVNKRKATYYIIPYSVKNNSREHCFPLRGHQLPNQFQETRDSYVSVLRMPEIRTEPYFLSCGLISLQILLFLNNNFIKFTQIFRRNSNTMPLLQKDPGRNMMHHDLMNSFHLQISLAGIHKLKSVEGNKENGCEKLEHYFCNLLPKSQIRIPNGIVLIVIICLHPCLYLFAIPIFIQYFFSIYSLHQLLKAAVYIVNEVVEHIGSVNRDNDCILKYYTTFDSTLLVSLQDLSGKKLYVLQHISYLQFRISLFRNSCLLTTAK